MSGSLDFNLALFAGPSGGHVFPALAFAEAMRKAYPGCHCHVIVPDRVSPFLQAWLLVDDVTIHTVQDCSLKSILSLKGGVHLIQSIRTIGKIRKLMGEIRPKAVVAFGSWVSIPGVIFGRLGGLPVVLHEQNVQIGRANVALAPFATRIAVTFDKSLEHLPTKKTTVVGNPIRSELTEAASKTRQPSQKKRILVLGGSQGSSFINQITLDVFRRMPPEERADIAVVHITGVGEFSAFEHAYDSLGMENEVFPYSDEMFELYRSTDLVIGRAGAGTLTESGLFGLPSILIPYPFAGRHQ